MMSDHSHYEELAALAAGGHLSDQELAELQQHAEACAECKDAVAEFREVVCFGLPLAQRPFLRSINMIMSRPDHGARERFIRRASLESIAFSPEVRRPTASRGPRLSFAIAGAGLLAAMVIGVLSISHHLVVPFRQLGQLSQQNSTLEATISGLEQTNAELRRENEGLRGQFAKLTATKSHHNDRTSADTTQLASLDTRSPEEIEAQQKAQEKLLDDARAELAELKKTRASDQASIVADQIRINEIGRAHV